MSKFYECHVRSSTCLTTQSLPQNQNLSKENKIKQNQLNTQTLFFTNNYLSPISSIHLAIRNNKIMLSFSDFYSFKIVKLVSVALGIVGVDSDIFLL